MSKVDKTIIDFSKLYTPSPRQAQAHMAKSRYVLFGGACGGGKLEVNTNKIVTPFGLKQMGDMEVGDLVCTPTGTASYVVAVWPQGIQPVYRVSFSDGASVLVGKDHSWTIKKAAGHSKMKCCLYTKDGKALINNASVYTTEELKKHIDDRHNRKLPSYPLIPMTEPVEFTPGYRNKKASIPVDPYVLGVLLGDGCISGRSVSFTTGDMDVIKQVKACGYPNVTISGDSSRMSVRLGARMGMKSPTRLGLERLGLWGSYSDTKFIPEAYQKASLEDRWALVQGIMDTDGSVHTNGRRCEWTSVSKTMADQFRWVLMSLGFRANMTDRIGSYRNDKGELVECKRAYTLDIQGRYRNKLFRLPRKADKVLSRYNGESVDENPVLRRMISIESEGEAECQCITIRHPYGLYCTEDFIVTHNSVWLSAEAIQLSLDFPNNMGYLSRHENAIFKKTTLLTLMEIMPQAAVTKHNLTDQFIEFINGSRIYYGGLRATQSDKPLDRLKSWDLGWFGIDEASETVKSAFMMLQSRLRRKGIPSAAYRGLLASNPEPGWLKVDFIDNPMPQSEFIPSLPSDNPHLPEDYVDRLRETFASSAGWVERYLEGDWNATTGMGGAFHVFSWGMIRGASERDVKMGEPVEMGVDVARGGTDNTVVFLRRGSAAMMLLDRNDIGDTMKVAEIVKTFIMRYEPTTVRVDAIGIGAGVADRLTQWFGYKIKHFIAGGKAVDKERFFNARSEATWLLRERFENGDISIPDDPELKGQLSSIRYSMSADRQIAIEKKEDMRKRGMSSPDKLDALMLAFGGGTVSPINIFF